MQLFFRVGPYTGSAEKELHFSVVRLAAHVSNG